MNTTPIQLPDYWLPRPPMRLDASTRAAFDRLLADNQAPGTGRMIAYTLPAPKWQFLCYAAEQQPIALHGSGNPSITVFEPRLSNDLQDFGRQRAVYAAADGLWAMFFAIIDRDRYSMSISNACIRIVASPQEVSEPLYVFSINHSALVQRPWRRGVVYLLPRASFVVEAPMPFGPVEIRTAQLASLSPVAALAGLEVGPEDFPMLEHIRSHADDGLADVARAMRTGAPWPAGGG